MGPDIAFIEVERIRENHCVMDSCQIKIQSVWKTIS